MNVDSIRNGIVLDHITAGNSMRIYRYLDMDKLDCTVALIQNVKSGKMGKKDIIKIDAPINLNFEIIGYIDPDITVNIIKEDKLYEKKRLATPKRLENVLKCRNPRCITAQESDLAHIFKLTDEKKRTYRCAYCETENRG